MKSILKSQRPKNRKAQNERERLVILKGATWLTTSKIIIHTYTFFVHIYVVSLLSPAEYALIGLGLLLLHFTDAIHEFGLGVSVIQKDNITKQELNSIFWFTLIIGVILFLIFYGSAHSIENFFGKTGLRSIIRVLACALLLKAAAVVPLKLLERNLKFKFKALVDLISKFLSLSAAGVFAFFGFGLWSLIYAQVINAVSILVFSFYFERFIPNLSLNPKFIKQTLGFGLNIVALRVTWYFRNNMDKIISGKILSSINFGYYSLSFRLTAPAVDIIKGVVSTISLPLLAKNKKDLVKINETYLNIVKYASLISFPLFIGGAILGRDIIHTLLPEKWAATSTIFMIVCILQIFRIMSSPNEDLFVALGKPNFSVLYNLISLFPLSLAILIGIQWNIKGLLVALLVTVPIINITWTMVTLKYRRIELLSYLQHVMPAILGTGVMAIIIYVIKSYTINSEISRFSMGALLIGLIIIGGISYFIVIYWYDKNIIESLKFSKKTRVGS